MAQIGSRLTTLTWLLSIHRFDRDQSPATLLRRDLALKRGEDNNKVMKRLLLRFGHNTRGPCNRQLYVPVRLEVAIHSRWGTSCISSSAPGCLSRDFEGIADCGLSVPELALELTRLEVLLRNEEASFQSPFRESARFGNFGG